MKGDNAWKVEDVCAGERGRNVEIEKGDIIITSWSQRVRLLLGISWMRYIQSMYIGLSEEHVVSH